MKRSGYRSNKERIFEKIITKEGIQAFPANEGKRMLHNGKSVKTPEALIESRFYVDVKGKKFPYGNGNYWENYVSSDDIDGLLSWKSMSNKKNKNTKYASLIAYVYELPRKKKDLEKAITELKRSKSFDMSCLYNSDGIKVDEKNLYKTSRKIYAMLAVDVSKYNKLKVSRSAAWNAVYVPRDEFRKIAVPLKSIFDKYKN